MAFNGLKLFKSCSSSKVNGLPGSKNFPNSGIFTLGPLGIIPGEGSGVTNSAGAVGFTNTPNSLSLLASAGVIFTGGKGSNASSPGFPKIMPCFLSSRASALEIFFSLIFGPFFSKITNSPLCPSEINPGCFNPANSNLVAVIALGIALTAPGALNTAETKASSPDKPKADLKPPGVNSRSTPKGSTNFTGVFGNAPIKGSPKATKPKPAAPVPISKPIKPTFALFLIPFTFLSSISGLGLKKVACSNAAISKSSCPFFLMAAVLSSTNFGKSVIGSKPKGFGVGLSLKALNSSCRL